MALIKKISPADFAAGPITGSDFQTKAGFQWTTKGFGNGNGNLFLLHKDNDPFGNGKPYFRLISADQTVQGGHTFGKAIRAVNQTLGVFYDEIWFEYAFRFNSDWYTWDAGKLGYSWTSQVGACNNCNGAANAGRYATHLEWMTPNHGKSSIIWPTTNPPGPTFTQQDFVLGLNTYCADTRVDNSFSEAIILTNEAGVDNEQKLFVADTDYRVRVRMKVNTPSSTGPYDGILQGWWSEDDGATWTMGVDVQDLNWRGNLTYQFEDEGFVFFRGGDGTGYEVGGPDFDGTSDSKNVPGVGVAPRDTWMYVQEVIVQDTSFFAGSTLSDPQGFSIVAGTDPETEIDLSWTSYVDQAANVLIQIQRSTDNVNFTTINQALSSSTSYTDSSLMSGTTYYYRIRAVSTDASSNDSNYTTVQSLQTQSTPPPSNCDLEYFNPNSSQWVDANNGINTLTIPDTESTFDFRSNCSGCIGGTNSESLAALTNTTVATDSVFASGITGQTYNIDPRTNNSETQNLTHINGTAVSVGVTQNESLGGETVGFTLQADGTVDVTSTGDITAETVTFRYQDLGTPAASDNETVTLTFATFAGFDWSTADGGFYGTSTGRTSGSWSQSAGNLTAITGLEGEGYTVASNNFLWNGTDDFIQSDSGVDSQLDTNGTTSGNLSPGTGAFTHLLVFRMQSSNSLRHINFQNNGGANTIKFNPSGIEFRTSGFTTETISNTFTNGVTYFIAVGRNAAGNYFAYIGTTGTNVTDLGTTTGTTSTDLGGVNYVSLGNDERYHQWLVFNSELTPTQIQNAFDQAKVDYTLG